MFAITQTTRRKLSLTTFYAALLVMIPCLARGASAPQSVEIRPLGVAVTKVKKLDPAAMEADLGEAGMSVTFGVRVTDGRCIRTLSAVDVSKAVDEQGTDLPAVSGPAETVTVRTDGNRTVTRTSSRSVNVTTRTEPRLLRRLILGEKSRTETQRFAAANLAQVGDGTTAVVTVKLGAPSPNAKSLKRLEGVCRLDLATMKSYTFGELRSRVGEALELGKPKRVALEITKITGGKISLKATGDMDRLAELEFFDVNGTRLFAESRSRSETETDGVGQAEMEYGFGDLLPAEMNVTVLGTPETVEVPFVFENIELP